MKAFFKSNQAMGSEFFKFLSVFKVLQQASNKSVTKYSLTFLEKP